MSCEAAIDEGDHKIRDESVDVDSKVDRDFLDVGRQERDVIAASCPTRRASKVTENWSRLEIQH